MQIRSAKLSLVLFLVFCAGSALSAWAQSTSTGTVAGSVADPTGALVSGAAVTLTDTATNVARSTTTNATGRYIYVDVNPGIYNIAVSKAGFETTKTENQEVKVGASLTVNLTLQVGGANVVVEVSAVGNELQTMNATVGNTITNLTIDNLPSLGRDVSTFIALQPGVSPDGSVAGTVVDQSAFSLDGGDNTNDMDGSMNVYTKSFAGDPSGGVANQNSVGPSEGGKGVGGATGVLPTPQDSVEEFKVNTAGQTADFNSSSGSEVKVVTKRGTDAWHGTAYEYYKDNNWSSNSWQNNHNDPITPIPSFHYSRYGGAIGGPLIPKQVLGGKTYFFFNYEGFNFPDSETIVRNVPSPTLQLGLLKDDATGAIYNLNPTAVTYNGITSPGTTLDPRGIGINPLVQQIWNKYEPASNANCTQTLCDTANVQGFSANLAQPTTSKFAVGRLDHDFSSKWHFMSSYRWFELKAAADAQVDIGGFFPGDTLGTPASQSNLPQQAFLWTAGLTTNISTNTTNDLHYSFLRNFWQWKRTGDTPQTATLGGALEIDSGQSAGFGQVNDLGPYNVDTQNTRNRFWDGHDQMLRDDISTLKGNHLFTFGGTYEHNWDYHQRTDNGGGINNQVVYELGDGTSGSLLAQDIPLCGQAGVTISNCSSLTAAALGIVSISQVAYTRSGANLTLNPIGTPAFDKSKIPYYNVYFSDTWHMKPTFTLTYGLGWTLEMPPVEQNGKQVELVDSSDQVISGVSYLDARKRAALQGQVYNPEIGFALLGNTANGPKYPYNPFYGSFSPRVAAAWNPHFDSDSFAGKLFGHEDTVVRVGYGRIFGRLNGVDLVLVPLLGPGLLQPTQCVTGLSSGNCGAPGSNNASTAFRIGVDGLTAPLQQPSTTLPQPYYPGVNGISSATASVLDPNFRPNEVDSVNLTIQRQLSRKVILEVGYIGRRITHEYQPVNLNAVPYMMTLGGQKFSQAYANLVLQYCGGAAGLAGGGCAGASTTGATAVTPQPFFETALGGATSAYCSTPVMVGGTPITPTSCTQAVTLNEGVTGKGNLNTAQVWNLWSDLDAGPMQNSNGGLPGPTMMNNLNAAIGGTSPQMMSGPADNASTGYGNYNAGFASLKMADWRGLTLQSNFTYSKALGTGALVQATGGYTPDDPFNLGTMYGNQTFNRKFVYNFFFVYQPPFFKGQSGLLGRALGGWTFSTVFSAGSGAPVELFTSTGDGQEYGAGDNVNYFGNENIVPVAPATSGHRYDQPGGQFPNLFKAGPAAVNDFRNPILGLDNKDCGYGCIPGLPYWNMDLSVRKNFRVAEGISMEIQGVFANVFNHDQFLDPDGFFETGLFSGSGPGGFGTLSGGSAQEEPGGNRQIEVGARVRF
ncbi:MAG: carboxypeptidase-like regulatory domain-containing protein [Candidatus Sulfotelmatobacter sp.]